MPPLAEQPQKYLQEERGYESDELFSKKLPTLYAVFPLYA